MCRRSRSFQASFSLATASTSTTTRPSARAWEASGTCRSPWVRTQPRCVRRARAAGFVVLAADGARGDRGLEAGETSGLLDQRVAWLFGNEAWGLPDDLAALADRRVSIPIFGRAESLNLSTAAAVCLYASARRRAWDGSVEELRRASSPSSSVRREPW